MLSKLLKYDFKAICKYFVPMTIFMLAYSLLGTLLFNIHNLSVYEESTLYNIAVILVITAFIVMIIAYNLITQGVIVINFYKSMATDTGYLTHTLPVKKSTILLSKTLTSVIILAISTFVLGICLFVFLDVPSNFAKLYPTIANFLTEIKDIVGTTTLVWTIIAGILVIIASYLLYTSMYFASIAFGQLINRHKIIGSFVSYFVISLIFQIFTSIFSFLFSTSSIVLDSVESLAEVNTSIIPLFLVGCSVLEFVFGFGLLFVTHWIFTKKLNLD